MRASWRVTGPLFFNCQIPPHFPKHTSSGYDKGMTLRLQNPMLAILLALTTLFVGLGTLSQKPASGGYQLFGGAVSGHQADIPLAVLGNFDYFAKIAPECCNAPKGAVPDGWRPITGVGEGDPLEGLAIIGQGNDPLSQGIAAGSQKAVELSMATFPDQTIAVLGVLEAANGAIEPMATFKHQNIRLIESQLHNAVTLTKSLQQSPLKMTPLEFAHQSSR